ncbi:Flagellar motor switch protein fliM [Pseudovibrio sp. FO-BEG1]|uniref:Flagellar motor switch protein FliM n=1 Tax=Pseudovibrio denitrificans TaxID=258256 RepID=A0A1I6ZN36_9HYPH|nr:MULTISPECIES: flagellar motor switch protein FliM [Pseudovibrio]AEV38591.1 Flagellar motor switch protein fliM [Pseudovibrio sp. FO-BEG1]EEA95611.1 flagellar motor switch protein FliM [Pseudovibrio sp. JE062]SFT64057.1 flagellar motor switch protein FliM [Pseudovibrio denitrificans]
MSDTDSLPENENMDDAWDAALSEGGSGDSDEDLAAAWGAALQEQGVEGGEEAAAQWAAMIDDSEPDLESASRGADRILNQEEIDNLLGFTLDGSLTGDEGGIRALINSAMVSYERLPMLEIVFDRLVRLTTTSLRNFTSDNVEVSLDSMTNVRFGDYLNSIPLPAILGVFKAKEWDGFGLVTVESSLIYSIIDVLLGGGRGSSPTRVEGRPYTTIESNLVRRMIEIILLDAEQAFGPLSPVSFPLERLETNPRFAAISRPANAAIMVELRIDMEDRGGKVEIVLPYATLEPIRDLLLQMFMGEKFGRDPIWEEHLATEVYSSEVQVDAVLYENTIPLQRVLNLEVGQTLLFDTGPRDPVQVKCGGVQLTEGLMGHVDDRISIEISKKLKQPKMTLAAFEKSLQSELETN